MSKELAGRITAYLASGGLFNPEYANHDAVRDLLIDCREALSGESAIEPKIERGLQAFVEKAEGLLKTMREMQPPDVLLKQITWAGEARNLLEDTVKQIRAAAPAERKAEPMAWIDLEATRLCAQAMGVEMPDNDPVAMAFTQGRVRTAEGWTRYDPLHDDAQCFALVKRFDMVIEREKDKTFGVTLFHGTYKSGKPVEVVRNEPNLNRAIAYVVAAMQMRLDMNSRTQT